MKTHGKIFFWNTLNKTKQEFLPIKEGQVSMYTCGPTVYNYAHIGNLRSYFMSDLIKRVLALNGLSVKQIMNITDIGHLTGDNDDSGEDKMVNALKRENKELTIENLKNLGEFYFAKFKEDLESMNILFPDQFVFASDETAEYSRLIEDLLKKGVAYKTSNTIYFDTTKIANYGAFGGSSSTEHSRIGIDKEKKNLQDFALWKFSENNKVGFHSTLGRGFPGWHIECTAMSLKYLGQHFDIHTGGVDHIGVHHTNEIAQAEALTGENPANFWIHNEHLTIRDEKMAKSGDNFLSLQKIKNLGVPPLSYRYFLLTSRYSTRIDYSPEALQASDVAYKKILNAVENLDTREGIILDSYRGRFLEAVNDDLDTPKAVALLWEILKDDELSEEDKKATVFYFDQVLGLNLKEAKKEEVAVSDEVKSLLRDRKKARVEKNWHKSDDIREKIKNLGYEINDKGENQELTKVDIFTKKSKSADLQDFTPSHEEIF